MPWGEEPGDGGRRRQLRERACPHLSTPVHCPERRRGPAPTRRASVLSVTVTGNIASGKSSLLRVWARAGVPVISADDLARAVVEPGTAGLREVVRVFGDE
ncbi:MAG: dephospho-CoA kinase, partial [Gammaproteobacteria bacterium]|nr:dephospho-CoA kinase [Gammaproteobacteria bacterium]